MTFRLISASFAILLAAALHTSPGHAGETGTLKIGSAPIVCTIQFRGDIIRKDQAVLTYAGIPAGRYRVSFSKDGRSITKSATVRAGKVTFVFGNLTTREEVQIKAKKVPLRPENRAATPPAPAKSPEQRKGSFFDSIRTPPEPKGPLGTPIDDADLFFEIAEILRRSVNPFQKPERYKKAERVYITLLDRWPKSNKVEASHYRLGNIYESVYYRAYQRAIERYEDLLKHNFHTTFPARYRIAVIYESRFKDLAKAKEWYALAAKYCMKSSYRKTSEKKVQSLTAKGF